jgi:hypothetical protein
MEEKDEMQNGGKETEFCFACESAPGRTQVRDTGLIQKKNRDDLNSFHFISVSS